jgi:hypothetical protein
MSAFYFRWAWWYSYDRVWFNCPSARFVRLPDHESMAFLEKYLKRKKKYVQWSSFSKQ